VDGAGTCEICAWLWGWCGGACSGLKQLVSSFTTYGSASLQDLFGVKLSLGSVNQLRQEASGAVVEAVAAAQTYAAAKRRGDG